SETEQPWLRSGGRQGRSRAWVPLILGAGLVLGVAGLGVWRFRASPPQAVGSTGSSGPGTSTTPTGTALTPSASPTSSAAAPDIPTPVVTAIMASSTQAPVPPAPCAKRRPVATSSHAPVPPAVPP